MIVIPDPPPIARCQRGLVIWTPDLVAWIVAAKADGHSALKIGRRCGLTVGQVGSRLDRIAHFDPSQPTVQRGPDWTPDEIRALRLGCAKGESWDVISIATGRRRGACRAKADDLDIRRGCAPNATHPQSPSAYRWTADRNRALAELYPDHTDAHILASAPFALSPGEVPFTERSLMARACKMGIRKSPTYMATLRRASGQVAVIKAVATMRANGIKPGPKPRAPLPSPDRSGAFRIKDVQGVQNGYAIPPGASWRVWPLGSRGFAKAARAKAAGGRFEIPLNQSETDAIAAFLASGRATICPAAAVADTTATVDTAALIEHHARRNADRLTITQQHRERALRGHKRVAPLTQEVST